MKRNKAIVITLSLIFLPGLVSASQTPSEPSGLRKIYSGFENVISNYQSNISLPSLDKNSPSIKAAPFDYQKITKPFTTMADQIQSSIDVSVASFFNVIIRGDIPNTKSSLVIPASPVPRETSVPFQPRKTPPPFAITSRTPAPKIGLNLPSLPQSTPSLVPIPTSSPNQTPNPKQILVPAS